MPSSLHGETATRDLCARKWGCLLLAWGYLQYLFVGRYRLLRAGGGGASRFRDLHRRAARYRYTREPMYLGHLIFMLGLDDHVRSWFALVLTCGRGRFHGRVLRDERRLEARFGGDFARLPTACKAVDRARNFLIASLLRRPLRRAFFRERREPFGRLRRLPFRRMAFDQRRKRRLVEIAERRLQRQRLGLRDRLGPFSSTWPTTRSPAAASSASGTTSCTRPMRRASSALKRSPVSP